MNIQSEALLARSRLLAHSKAHNCIPIGASAESLLNRSGKFLSSISFLSTEGGTRYLSTKGLTLAPFRVQEGTEPKETLPYPSNPTLQSAQEFCDEANDARLNALLDALHARTALTLTLTYQKALKRDWQEKKPNLSLLTAAGPRASNNAPASLDPHYAPLLVCYAHIVKQMNTGKIALQSAAESFLYHSQAFCTEKKYEPVVGLWRFLSLVGSGSVKNPSCTFLESLYAEHIAQTVAQHPRALRAGAENTVLDRVISFSRIFIQANSASLAIGETVLLGGSGGTSEVSFWAVLYFLIRAGHTQEALQWIQRHRALVDQAGLRELLTLWLEQDKAQNVPKASYEGSLDTFKSLILRLISPASEAPLEEEKKKKNFSSIINKTECYVWFQLRTTRDLQGLAAHFSSLGPGYFGGGLGAVLLYALVLGLVGLWTEAISLLVDKSEFRVDAIHMALWLWSIGKIRASPAFTAIASRWLMNFDGGELAVQYPLALKLGQGADWEEVAEDQLAFIVAHCEGFGQLIGPKGTLAERAGVALKAAHLCLRGGRESQAIILFHAAGASERVIGLLVKQGKKALLSASSNNAAVLKFIDQSSSLVDYYQSSGSSLMLRPLQILIVLSRVSVAFSEGRFEECVALVDSLELLPSMDESNRMQKIRDRARDLCLLLVTQNDHLALGVPLVEWLLVMVERCYSNLALKLPHRALEWRGRSRDLICFASMLLHDEEGCALGMQVFGELTRLDNEIGQ